MDCPFCCLKHSSSKTDKRLTNCAVSPYESLHWPFMVESVHVSTLSDCRAIRCRWWLKNEAEGTSRWHKFPFSWLWTREGVRCQDTREELRLPRSGHLMVSVWVSGQILSRWQRKPEPPRLRVEERFYSFWVCDRRLLSDFLHKTINQRQQHSSPFSCHIKLFQTQSQPANCCFCLQRSGQLLPALWVLWSHLL